MRGIFLTTALGSVLLATAAHAQVQVLDEPAAITPTPNGTVITRWPLQTIPAEAPSVIIAPSRPAPALVPAPVIVEQDVLEQSQTVGEHRSTRKTAKSTKSGTHATARSANASRRQGVTAASTTSVRRRFAAVPHALAPPPVALTPMQRQMVYRTIVLREVLPTPIAPVGPVVTAPALVPAPVETPIGALDEAGARATYRAPSYPGTTFATTYSPAYVGTQVPATVLLMPLPSTLVAQVPVVQSYRYAVLNDRLLLVDPETNVVVADVTND